MIPSTFNQQLDASAFYKDGRTYNVYPNPVLTTTTLYLSNSPVDYEINVSDPKGLVCFNQKGTANKILLDAATWLNGKYIFQLQIGYQLYVGTFMVLTH